MSDKKHYKRMPSPDEVCLGTKIHRSKKRLLDAPDIVTTLRCLNCLFHCEFDEIDDNGGFCDKCMIAIQSECE
jgi:hypothetical protein